MRKNKAKFIRRMMDSPITALLLNIGLFFLFFIPAVLLSGSDFHNTFTNIIVNGVAVSVILVEFVKFIAGLMKKKLDNRLEESEKTTDDYPDIIKKYSEHEKIKEDSFSKNDYQEEGFFMKIKNYQQGDDIKPEVELPALVTCVNVDGEMKLKAIDSPKSYVLPDLITANVANIMQAHKTSKIENYDTIRLDDATFDKDTNELTLYTSRTCYYQMLLTNRCMDYEFATKMTVRSAFEYRKKILPLNKSKMGNQIGVEGLILTNDGWALVEKRLSEKRTTWRDKFAQPISLSMKKDGLELVDDEVIKDTVDALSIKIKGMMKKYLQDTFGLLMDQHYSFDANKNFLGFERDLLEGGKPNVYFYVIVDMDHLQLKEVLEKNGRIPNLIKKPEDLKRKYYLYPFEECFAITDDMVLAMKMDRAIRLYRTDDKIHWTKFKMLLRKCGDGLYKKECGESFLGCLSFYQMCKDRIDKEIYAKGNING
jgi:hypothetical protein